MRAQEGPAFRYTTSEVTVQPSPCLSYRIPRDFVDLSAGEDAYKLIDFLKLVGLRCISFILKAFLAWSSSIGATNQTQSGKTLWKKQ